MHHPDLTLRPYLTKDSESWLRCRVLSFLHTQYCDDVKPDRTVLVEPAIALVATSTGDHVDRHNDVDGDAVLGILDIEISGDAATIDTIATHPDHQARGIATALLHHALPMLADRGVATLDAWTREDVSANAWYRANGFAESFRYVHVHAPTEREAELRERFRRVYVCRQYLKEIVPR